LRRDAETRRTDDREAPRAADPEDASGEASWAELLGRTLEEREHARDKAEEVPWREPTPATPRRLHPVAGCLVRLVLFVLFVIALGLVGLFVLMGGLLQ
jgi:hypothetical protein